ncbi:palmitoyl-acyl carrier protein thioesterase, chloroplastic-like [Euphorbia lathyris]|uniref:palmitoyl-acyl carrier protein thioesterase, chloroplastic-like n=1 Tax=Euphorbia lathyris TaxID=212925 RepID=UPI0033142950
MVRNNLIWAVSKLQVQIDHYPIWGEVVEIDSWVGASGKNGMRRDWQSRATRTCNRRPMARVRMMSMMHQVHFASSIQKEAQYWLLEVVMLQH